MLQKTKKIGEIKLQNGHKLFQVHTKTLEIAEVQREQKETKVHTPFFKRMIEGTKSEVVIDPDMVYIPALNKKNVIKILKRDYNLDKDYQPSK